MEHEHEDAQDLDVTRAAPSVAMTVAAPAAGSALTISTGGNAALATMSDAEFAIRIASMKTVRERMRQVKAAVLTPGVHYGFPGAKSAEEIAKAEKNGQTGLYKAGAEVILDFFGLVAGEPTVEITNGDPLNTTSPTFVMHARVPIHRGDASGPVVAVGIGAWSTWETKNRYRYAKRKCPACGLETLVMMKEAKRGEFMGQATAWCGPRDGGCGAEFLQSDEKIAGQKPGRVPNVDAADLLNTGVKMSKKRALVDGTISATSLSEIFTQDVEDMTPEQRAEMQRRVDAGADAAVNDMYGPPPQGDDWRDNPEGEPKPNGKASPATDSANLASDKQKGMIESLAQKKLPGGKAKLDAWLADNRKPSLAALSKTAASAVIGALQKMEDVPATTDHDKAAQTNYSKTVQRVKDLLFEVEGREKRKVWDKREDGEWCVVGQDELEHIGYVGPVTIAALSIEELIKLGQHLKARVEGAAA